MKTTHLSIMLLICAFMLTTTNIHGQKKHKKDKAEQVDTLNYVFVSGQTELQLTFLKGESHNHPTFAIWAENKQGELIETLFVTEYFATGIFGNADAGDGTWKTEKGESLRPAALPYWTHKRNIISRDSLLVPTPENPVADAITGATPAGSFVLNTSIPGNDSKEIFVFMEVNQTWDWNEYWTNNKYPDDKNYKSSAQPSVIYSAKIDLSTSGTAIELKPIGHGHYSGKDGSLTTDLSTLTTALEIFSKINVSIITD